MNDKKTITPPKYFVNLHGHSNASIGDALSKAPEHMDFAISNGLDALAITDHGNMNAFSHQYLHQEKIKEKGIDFKSIYGLEAYYIPSLSKWKELYNQDRENKAFEKANKNRLKQDNKIDLRDDVIDLTLSEEAVDEDTKGTSGMENEEESKSGKYNNSLFQRNHLVLLAKNNIGLKSLFKMVSLSYKDGFYKYPRIDLDMIRENAKGNIIASTACLGSNLGQTIFENQESYVFDKGAQFSSAQIKEILNHNSDKIQQQLQVKIASFQEALGGVENFYLELQFNKLFLQHLMNYHLIEAAKRTGAPIIVTCDSHYANPNHWREREIYKAMSQLQFMKKTQEEVLASIPQQIDELKCELYPKNAEQLWKSYYDTTKDKYDFYDDELVRDAIQRTHSIAHDQIDNVTIDKSVKLPKLSKLIEKDKLDQLLSTIKPEQQSDEDAVAFEQLKKDVIVGAKWRKIADKKEYIERLKHELSVVKYLKFSKYFLTYAKIMELLSSKMLTGIGRGSAAGSLLAYVLNITQLDPIKYNLLFGRFLSTGKKSYPDIDSDFADRDTAMEELSNYFGQENIVPVSNFNQLQLRSLIKDISKLNGLPFEEINKYTRNIEIEALSEAKKTPGFDAQQWQLTYDEADEKSNSFRELMQRYPETNEIIKVLYKQIKSLSRHAGGVSITDNAFENMPIIKSGGVFQTPWPEGLNYRHLESFGFLKFDVLGLGTLRMFENCIRRILKKQGNENPEFEDVKKFYYEQMHPDNNFMDDVRVYENVYWNGNYAGIFQFAQKPVQEFVRKMKPTSITDLAVATSIYRPGPLGLGVDKMYLKNRLNPDSIIYKHPLLKEVLADTCGLLIFQEQLQLIYHKLAGVPLDNTDDIRKALLKKDISNKEKTEKELKRLKQDFIDRCLEVNNISENISSEIFNEMLNFISYSFNKCLQKDSLIETETRGLVPIKNIIVGEKVNSKNGFVKVKDVHKNGVKKLYKIKTKNGKELVCTMDHKLETSEGMKTLEEILNKKIKIVIKQEIDKMTNTKFDEIVSCEYYGEEETYDLEVDHEDHTFFANGISVSNSHAASYAINSYQCAWLYTYYPDEWIASYIDYCINEKGAGSKEDPKEIALSEARTLGYKLGKPDINYSSLDFDVKDKVLIPSFTSLINVGAQAYYEIKQNRPYRVLEDLLWDEGGWKHSKLNKRALSHLIKTESFDSMELVGPGKTFENYNQMHYVLVDHGDELKKAISKKKKTHKEVLQRLLEECKSIKNWSLEEKIEFNKEIRGFVDNSLILTDDIRKYLYKAKINSIDDWTNEKELYWAITQSSKIATTKGGKKYCKVSMYGEASKTQQCFFWNFNPNKDKLLPENILIVGSFKKTDFGLSSFFGKIEVLETKK